MFVACDAGSNELKPRSWTNGQGSTQRAHFIVSGYSSSRHGPFTLSWNEEACCDAGTYRELKAAAVAKLPGKGLAKRQRP